MVSSILGGIAGGATVAIVIKGVDEFSKTFSSAISGTNKLSSVAKLGVAAMVGFGTAITATGIAAIKTAADFEQTQVAFETMLGSGEEAQVFLEELAVFAKKTPFTLKGVELGARQLMAVGFEAEEVIPTLRNVGNVASGLGLGQEGLQRLILNLGQVRTQGKLTGRELRDFAVAGVPLLDELAKSLGKSKEEITAMVSAGEITESVVTQAFAQMAGEGGKFANLMEKQAETVNGKFSNLQDTFELLQRELGAALLPVVAELADVFLNDVLPAIKPLIPLVSDFIKKFIEKLLPFLPQITEGLLRMSEVFLDLFDAISPLIEPLIEISMVLIQGFLNIIKPLIPSIKELAIALVPLLEILLPIVAVLLDMVTLLAKVAGYGLEKIASFAGGAFSKTKEFFVGDAILRPNGDIVHTSPNDTIFATQNPGSIGGSITINIERLQGIDAEEIAETLSRELSRSIRR